MRRLVVPLALVAALSLAAAAAAGLNPVRRTVGGVTVPRVRAGTIKIPAGQASGRLRVIVDLRLAPLAAAWGRTAQASGGTRHLDVASASSRAYLRRIDAEQRVAVARLHRAIPEARIGRRFRILLDGLTVTLPARRLPQLVRVAGVTHVYSSLRYTLAAGDPSPTVIGADALQATTGATGAGIKIGVVDDGIDQTNPYLSPAGFSYPAGFPKGNTAFTTPKVIVAKSFPGPNSGAVGALPVDRAASFHGTHVSGIAAGDAGTNAPAGRDHPAVNGLSGVAPRAWLGNYRVFTVPTPVGHVANTPEIVAAFEAAVSDGMNVINFSGGGPQTDPANDPMIETIQNVVAAGVTPVIAAGNDRDDFGAGTVGSPGVAPDAITVAAVSNSVVYAPTLSVQNADAPASLQAIPFESNDAPSTWATIDQTLVDVTSITGTDGKPVEAHLCGPAGNPNGAATTLPAGSLSGKIVLASRGVCAFVVKAPHAQAAGAVGIILVDNRAGEANPIPAQLPIPSGMIADLDGAQLRVYLATHGGDGDDPRRRRLPADRDRPERRDHELLVRRPDRVGPPAEAGHLGAGRPDPLLDPARVRGLAVRGLRRHEHGDPPHRGRGRAPATAAPGLDARADQVGADVDRRPGLGEHLPHGRGAGVRGGRRARPAHPRDRPAALHRARIALVSRPRRQRRRQEPGTARPHHRRGRRRGRVAGHAQPAVGERRHDDRPARPDLAAARRRGRHLRGRERLCRRRRRRRLRLRRPHPGLRLTADSRTASPSRGRGSPATR